MPEVKEELGVKELTELNLALMELGAKVLEQSEDGKLSITEIITDMPKAYKVVTEAKDFELIMAEVKDLTEAEMRVVFPDMLTFVFQVIGIVKNLS